jgi:hypothetical protein
MVSQATVSSHSKVPTDGGSGSVALLPAVGAGMAGTRPAMTVGAVRYQY